MKAVDLLSFKTEENHENDSDWPGVYSCPECKADGEKLDWGSLEVTTTMVECCGIPAHTPVAQQHTSCVSCEAEWLAVYVIAGAQVIEVGD